MLAQFRMQLVLLDLIEGTDLTETIPSLNVCTDCYHAALYRPYMYMYISHIVLILSQNVLEIVNQIPRLSIADLYLKSQALILLADLHLVAIQQQYQIDTLELSIELYRQAQECVLMQVSDIMHCLHCI